MAPVVLHTYGGRNLPKSIFMGKANRRSALNYQRTNGFIEKWIPPTSLGRPYVFL